jgi:ATP-dependent DNA helicase RecQ
MLYGKNHYNLDQVWIITTSDLTSAAITTAKNNDIQILNRDNVIEFLKEIQKHNVKFKEIKASKKEKEKDYSFGDNYPAEVISDFKKYRSEISKKYKLYPVYKVFNNKIMYKLIDEMPKTLEELVNIKGFEPKSVETFGAEFIEFINKKIDKSQKEDIDLLLYDMLISERSKIAKYNNLKKEDVYTDKVAEFLVRMKPKNRPTLEKVFGFRKESIDIFGDYLVKKLLVFHKNRLSFNVLLK